MPYLFNEQAHLRCPIWMQFSTVHYLHCRWKSGSSMVGSRTKFLLHAVADFTPAALSVQTDGSWSMCNQKGSFDLSWHLGGWVISSYNGSLGSAMIFLYSQSTAESLLAVEGAISDNSGSHGIGMDFRVQLTTWMVVFTYVSAWWVSGLWQERSIHLYDSTKAWVDLCRAGASLSQDFPERVSIMFILIAVFLPVILRFWW